MSEHIAEKDAGQIIAGEWVEVESRIEGGQPNGLGEIESSDNREWFHESRETHHRRIITLYGPWETGSVKDAGGEAWTDHGPLDLTRVTSPAGGDA